MAWKFQAQWPQLPPRKRHSLEIQSLAHLTHSMNRILAGPSYRLVYWISLYSLKKIYVLPPLDLWFTMYALHIYILQSPWLWNLQKPSTEKDVRLHHSRFQSGGMCFTNKETNKHYQKQLCSYWFENTKPRVTENGENNYYLSVKKQNN